MPPPPDIEQFLRTFIRADRQDRYRSLFALGLGRWQRITFHYFDRLRIESPVHRYVSGPRPVAPPAYHSPPPPNPLDDPDFALLRGFGDSHVDVYATGSTKHSGHKRGVLSTALLDREMINDGLICIVPGRLYIVLDHDDNLTICTRSET